MPEQIKVSRPVSSPGKILYWDYIKELGLDVSCLAFELGVTQQEMISFLMGDMELDDALAVSLTLVFDTPIGLWKNLEKNYRDSMAIVPKV